MPNIDLQVTASLIALILLTGFYISRRSKKSQKRADQVKAAKAERTQSKAKINALEKTIRTSDHDKRNFLRKLAKPKSERDLPD